MDLLIQYRVDGYTITCSDGITEMGFTDGTKTTEIPSLKDAINICVEHGYTYEIL